MRLAWRRRMMNRLSSPRDDAGEPTHEELVTEAKKAAAEGRKSLSDVAKLGDRVGETAERLRNARDRNHFSELVADMLRGGR
jgi:hypothetical protein